MWGVISPISGAVNTYLGLSAGFLTYAAVSAIAIIPGLMLPTDALKTNKPDAAQSAAPPPSQQRSTRPIATAHRTQLQPPFSSAPLAQTPWRASWRPPSHHPPPSHPVHLTDTFAVLGVPPPSVLATPVVSTAYIAEHHLLDHHTAAPSEPEASEAVSVFAAPWSPAMSAIGAVTAECHPSRETVVPSVPHTKGGIRRTQSASSITQWLLHDQPWEGVEQQQGDYQDDVYDVDEDEEVHRPRSDPGECTVVHEEAARNDEHAATLLTVDTLVFFVTCTVLGFGHAVIGTFLFLRLDELGAAPLLMGLVLSANSFSETPVFVFVGACLCCAKGIAYLYHQGTWLGRIGTEGVLTLALVALSVRYAAYEALAASRLWVLPIECLHSITYAGGWSACAIHSARVAPQGLEVTTQAIFQGLWLGLGGGAGLWYGAEFVHQ